MRRLSTSKKFPCKNRFIPTAVAATAWFLLSIAPLAFAQPTTSFPDNAQQALQTGQYLEARQLLEPLLKPGDSEVSSIAHGYLVTFLARGEYQKGLQQITSYLDRSPNNPYLLYARGQLLMAVGRYDTANKTFQQATDQTEDFWLALLSRGRLLEQMGRFREAETLYQQIYQSYRQGQFQSSKTLSIAARAAASLEQFHEANNAFRKANSLNSSHVPTLFGWAELFRDKYNTADAKRTYEDLLAVNPRHAGAYVGLAHTLNSFGKKEKLVQKALEINPNHVGALNLLTALQILDGQYEQARSTVEKTLAVNPSSITALAHQASVAFLNEQNHEVQEIEQRALSINSAAAEFYLTLADNLVHRFRYPAAVEYARQAVKVGNNNWQAYATLGAGLLRLGRFQEARRYLETSFRQDPFNLFAGNMLTLLDELEEFDVQESKHFRLFIHPSESAVLGSSILTLAEACYDSLRQRYPYRPEGKIILEAYNNSDDFAVRVAGVPHVGLLGVSFGDVVAINTPKAQTDQPYNWARTLWHELAHTMAIGTSSYQVPRWFTEGLSLYEEQKARPYWAREMDLRFFAAYTHNELLSLDQIDRGFTRPQFPEQVLLTYYHASQVITYIVDQHGFESIIDILKTLRAGHSVETSIKRVLGQDLASLDRRFRQNLQARQEQFSKALANLPPLTGSSQSPAGSNAFFKELQAANNHLEAKEYADAEKRFQAALDLFPYYVGPGNSYKGLAAIYRKQNNQQQLLDILRRYLDLAEDNVQASRELARLYQKNDQPQKAVYYFQRSLELDPYALEVHQQLANLYEQQRRYDQAIKHRQTTVALNPVDKAQALYKLAVSLYMDEQPGSAKETVVRSLEIAPNYREAQQLLLRCVETLQKDADPPSSR